MFDIVDFNGERSFDNIPEKLIPKCYTIWFPESLLGCNNFAIAHDFSWDCKERIDGLSLPEGLKDIETMAFAMCNKIRNSVTFPATLLRLEKRAFTGCIKKAVFLNPETEIGKWNFASNTNICGYSESSAYYYAMSNKMKFTEIEDAH